MTKERPAQRRPSPFRGERTDKPTDRTRALLDRLDAQVGAIQDSDSFRAYLDVQARFHAYSWGNVCLILGQRPEASRIAGYRAWQGLGRQVKRGETAIRIVVPMAKKAENPDTGDEERRTFFSVGHVFDIAQTEGEPLPQVEVPILEGDEGGQLYERLAAAAQADGVAVERTRDLGAGMTDTMGFYRPGEHPTIVVREASPLQMVKTLAHELSHHLTGKHETYGELRAEHETIAEASAYVVLAHFGLDSGERSFPYVATWAQDRAVLRGVLGTIQGVANTLITHVEEQHAVSASQHSPGDR
jgi:antirestriction protein ArdC